MEQERAEQSKGEQKQKEQWLSSTEVEFYWVKKKKKY